MSSYKRSIFITLTYDDEYLPKNKSISKRTLVKFIKRLRKKVEPRKIKYYACGEYGEKEGRPHYHAIILNIGLNEQELIKEAWSIDGNPLGFIKYGNVEYNSIRYVADYIHNTDAVKNIKRFQWIREGEKPFQIQSNGIGKRFVLENSKYLKEKLGCTVRGVEVGLPKYYKNILELSEKEKEELHIASYERIYKKMADKGLSDEEIFSQVNKMMIQREKNIKAKIGIKKDREPVSGSDLAKRSAAAR
ncbi:hypothetical protein ES705_34618 [subsurface metagenome]